MLMKSKNILSLVVLALPLTACGGMSKDAQVFNESCATNRLASEEACSCMAASIEKSLKKSDLRAFVDVVQSVDVDAYTYFEEGLTDEVLTFSEDHPDVAERIADATGEAYDTCDV